jgi:secondary thiamine-phosphate synthase enzyme
METLAPAFVYRHTKVRIATERPTEFIDLTDSLEALLAESGVVTGLLNVQSLHTTAGIVVNEGEPLLLRDFESLLHAVAPDDVPYRHDDETARTVNVSPGERPNGWSHCRALLLGTSACLNVIDGRLMLGRWQRVFLVELDGPRSRDVSVLLIGEAAQ